MVVVVVVSGVAVVAVVDEPELDAPEVEVAVEVLDTDEPADAPAIVVVVAAWELDPPATATPMPTLATTAVNPTATVVRRIRTNASSRERAPSVRNGRSGEGAMTAPFSVGPTRSMGHRWVHDTGPADELARNRLGSACESTAPVPVHAQAVHSQGAHRLVTPAIQGAVRCF